jgi:hypothetical protein
MGLNQTRCICLAVDLFQTVFCSGLSLANSNHVPDGLFWEDMGALKMNGARHNYLWKPEGSKLC